MNIVILAGGTGSIALQTGLYDILDKQIDGIDTKILVNCYDNGKSTSDVRKVLGGHILGPSDVRKNQTTRLQLENPSSPWIKFLDIRFTTESSCAEAFCHSKIQELVEEISKTSDDFDAILYDNDIDPFTLVREAVEEYFRSPAATKIDYNDFSLANIIYAGFAKANGNSLRAAAKIMAKILGIKDNVILNDDTSLFLGAITKNGIRVTDESDIVSWGDKDDPFVDVFFTDVNGNISKPMLCNEAKESLLNADLIVLSSGTQWSSLIPTYASEGFSDLMHNNIKAKVLMIMNKHPDKDSPGQTGDEIIDILVPKYFKPGQLHVLVDETGSSQMQVNNSPKIASCNYFKMGNTPYEVKHNPLKLATAVALTYFRDYVNSDYFMFDYDDTLVGRGNSSPRASAHNKKLLCKIKNSIPVSICTGNSIKAVAMKVEKTSSDASNKTAPWRALTVFADGGINAYSYDTHMSENDEYVKPKFVTCVHPPSVIDTNTIENVLSGLAAHGIPKHKIQNRGNVMLSIRPIDIEYRPIVLSLTNMLLQNCELVAKATGRTTIDISKPSVSKAHATNYVFRNDLASSITFVGDEFDGGNDADVARLNDQRIKCLSIKDPSETAFFLIALSHLKGIKE